ncbi:hypothetical protein [Streptosporangium sp. CA-115845]|uniref:hypothetical protein n=1 Tax=Streptosporangium sp. CA-115845 TaxID=3240071 RepID=UPI003D89FBEC
MVRRPELFDASRNRRTSDPAVGGAGASGAVAEPYLLGLLGLGLPHAADATRAKQAEVVADLDAYISGRKPYTLLSPGDTAAKSFSGSALARLREIKRSVLGLRAASRREESTSTVITASAVRRCKPYHQGVGSFSRTVPVKTCSASAAARYPAAAVGGRSRVKMQRPQAKPRTNDLDPGRAAGDHHSVEESKMNADLFLRLLDAVVR